MAGSLGEAFMILGTFFFSTDSNKLSDIRELIAFVFA